MSVDGYTPAPFLADAQALLERARASFAERFPNASLAPGSMLEWDVETDAQTAADISQLALTVAEDNTIAVLSLLTRESRRQATPAAGTATLLVTGETAVTVPAGTILEGTGPNGDPVSVEVVEGAAAGIGVTSMAGVAVQTLQTGPEVNGTFGPLLGMEQYPWGVSATLDEPLAGAEDEEDRLDYLGRLVRLARILSPRPITPEDIAEFVELKVQGIGAAVALENTNPGPPLVTNAAGHFAVGIRAVDGTAPPGPKVAEVQAILDGALTSTIKAHVLTANYTTVNVVATVRAWPGYDHTVLAEEARNRVAEYLSPERWGEPPINGDIGGGGDPKWAQSPWVFVAEIIERVGQVRGIDRAERTSVLLNGSNNDLELGGLLPLPVPGTIEITVLDR